MSCADVQVRVQACCVSGNYLAEAYLMQHLRADRRIHPLSLKQYARLSPNGCRNIVFVVDQLGLEVPLSECIRQLCERSAGAKFVVLGHDKPTEEIVRLLIMGVHGYIRHADVARALIPAIFLVASGALWVTGQAFHQFLSAAGHALRKNARAPETTTAREDEILELVRRRLSNREIGELLQIRVSTVKFHLSNILSKLHVHNRRELAEAPEGYSLLKSF